MKREKHHNYMAGPKRHLRISTTHHTFEMLDRAGLATSTLDTIKDIYTDSSTKIKTDEGLTTPINITQRVKQGCPLSPILFNFVVEGALAAIISANDDGFHIGEITIKSLAYGDDQVEITVLSSLMRDQTLLLRELLLKNSRSIKSLPSLM